MSAPTNGAPALTQMATTDPFEDLGINYEAAFARVPAKLRSLEWLLTQLPPHAHVVDLGCGTGKPAAAMLAAAGHAVVGVDVSPVMIELARRQVPGAAFHVADARTWEPPALPGGARDGGYDAVVVYFSFMAGVSRADIVAMFARAAGWLRPGGFFVFGTATDVVGEAIVEHWMGRTVISSGLTSEETRAGLAGAGMEVLREENEGYLPDAAAAGLREEDVAEEMQTYVYARKKGGD